MSSTRQLFPETGGRGNVQTSSRTACGVEGSIRREILDSEICEGLRQQVSDVEHEVVMMYLANEARTSSIDMTPQVMKKHSRRTTSGQIVQELTSNRDGKYWDDVRGGSLDTVLVREARVEEMQRAEKHAVHEKVLRSQSWEETGKNPIKTAWADTKKGTSDCPNKNPSDITFATIKSCSKMSRPDGQDLKNMKRVGRVLIGKRLVKCLFLSGRMIHTPCFSLLTQTGQETDSQGNRSLEA